MHVDGDGDEEHNDENHGGESEDGSHDGFFCQISYYIWMSLRMTAHQVTSKLCLTRECPLLQRRS